MHIAVFTVGSDDIASRDNVAIKTNMMKEKSKSDKQATRYHYYNVKVEVIELQM